MRFINRALRQKWSEMVKALDQIVSEQSRTFLFPNTAWPPLNDRAPLSTNQKHYEKSPTVSAKHKKETKNLILTFFLENKVQLKNNAQISNIMVC